MAIKASKNKTIFDSLFTKLSLHHQVVLISLIKLLKKSNRRDFFRKLQFTMLLVEQALGHLGPAPRGGGGGGPPVRR